MMDFRGHSMLKMAIGETVTKTSYLLFSMGKNGLQTAVYLKTQSLLSRKDCFVSIKRFPSKYASFSSECDLKAEM